MAKSSGVPAARRLPNKGSASKTKSKAKPKAKAKVAVKSKPKVSAKAKPKPKVKAKVVTKPKPVLKAKPKVAVKPKAKAKVIAKPKVASKPKPVLKAKPKVAVKPKAKAKVIAKPKVAIKPKPKVKLAAKQIPAKKIPSASAASKKQRKPIGKSASVTELTVDIKRYAPLPESPLPSMFSAGIPRNIYPHNHRLSQTEQSEIVPMRVVRLANEYIEADILPDLGGILWGAKDLSSGREMFPCADTLKCHDLGVAGAWLASVLGADSLVAQAVSTLEKVPSTHGVDADGSAWVRMGAVDKIFGLQWQLTLRLDSGARSLEIEGWLHNPTDQEVLGVLKPHETSTFHKVWTPSDDLSGIFDTQKSSPTSKIREDVRDPSEISADHYREIARSQMQIFNWKEASVYYEAARKLDENDERLKQEVGLFRLRRMEHIRARTLLRDAYEKGNRDSTLLWGLLHCAWALHDKTLEATVLSSFDKAQLDLAKALSCLLRKDAAGAVAVLKKYKTEDLVLQRDLAVAALVARRLVGKPDANLLKALDAALPLDPVVRFESADGSIDKLLDVDHDLGITLADTYLKHGDPASALKAVEMTAHRGEWQFNYLILAEHCAVQAKDARAGTFLKQSVDFDAAAERPWQDCFYTAIPEFFAQLPNDPRLHYLYGNLLQRYGRTEEALMQWRRSVSAGGDWLQLHLATALVDCRSTHYSSLNIGCLRTVAEKANDFQINEYYFEALRHTGRREDLLEEYRKRLKRPNCHPEIRTHYAIELTAQHLYKEAIEYMQMTDFPPSHGGTKLSRAYLACRIAQGRDWADKEQWEVAKKEIQRGFTVQPNFNEDTVELRCLAEAYCLLGEIETKQSYADIARGEKAGAELHANAARVWYEKAAAEDHPLTSYLRVWKCKGLMHSVKAAEGEETIQRIQRWVSSNFALPHDTHAQQHYVKSHLFRMKGDIVRAKQEEEIALKTGMLGFAW